MAKTKVEDVVRRLVLPLLEVRNFELVDVEFKKEGADWYLRVFIDKPGGITIDDCEAVSVELSDLLDEEDPIEQTYILEVSSPGIDRPLKTEKDFKHHVGTKVEVKLYKPFMGQKVYKGILIGYEDRTVEIELDQGQRLSFSVNDIALVKPVIEF